MDVVESEELEDGTKLKFRTNEEKVEVYKDGQWSPLFVKGMNVGATLPGHFPGELPMTKDQYLEWFEMMDGMGVNTLRVYTIHEPVFYEALVEYNRSHSDDPLYFMQGIWSPVELMKETENARDPDVTKAFKKEIKDAIGAVYGDIKIPEENGKASGAYNADASPYLLAWHIGTEWSPQMVESTNEKSSDDPAFRGSYFKAAESASPFESWLAELLNYTAALEAERGWEHPMTITNWVTTDPLDHPTEPHKMEDMVSVDPTKIEVNNWRAGYFASYHAYPYYPDFFKTTDKYNHVKNEQGKVDTYKGYLQDLKAYHEGMPIMITEFGVPSSRGNAHFGPLGRDQGGHSEQMQGELNADLLNQIDQEEYAGAVLFSWQDEWFKKTWNVMPFTNMDRNPFWYNVLSAETSYGVLGMYPGKHGVLQMDGELLDWKELEDVETFETPLGTWSMTHDEGYLYLSGRLLEPLSPETEPFYIGADTINGGTKQMAGQSFSEGFETMVRLGKKENSEVLIAEDYDFHQRLYEHASATKEAEGFHSWKLITNYQRTNPATDQLLPFEEAEVGGLERGVDWEVKGRQIEVRIPWALLGFADPSTKQVARYGPPVEGEKKLYFSKIEGIHLVPMGAGDLVSEGEVKVEDFPFYTWDPWQQVEYQVEIKKSYQLMKQAFQQLAD
ncbi:hypothetical protein LCM20_12420 [Halobacillus litoralis]|uniref:hypothetical protein n=1 Tax=Halobacillus litoralis TaxID=45668 RepID=UPI001CD809FC|nr:hypothetical protein [Halobacillus litoralis]MCA0971401.1 hypothetical protein [Halobacillus litoralis]